jgi:hypothetical protein
MGGGVGTAQNLESLMVNYDGTVRDNSDNSVVQGSCCLCVVEWVVGGVVAGWLLGGCWVVTGWLLGGCWVVGWCRLCARVT